MGTWWQHWGDQGGEKRNWPPYLTCQWFSISVLSNRHSPTNESIRDYLTLPYLTLPYLTSRFLTKWYQNKKRVCSPLPIQSSSTPFQIFSVSKAVPLKIFYLHFFILILIQGDGRYLISNSKDQTIKLWDMRKFASKDSVRVCRQLCSF